MERVKIIYCRVSTDRKGDNAQSPELQIEPCVNTFPETNVAEIHIERKSAYKDNVKRPVLEAIMTRVKMGEVESITVFDLDRLFRNRQKLAHFFDFCREHKCKIQSVNQKWLSDIHNIKPEAVAEMVLGIMTQLFGYLGQEESYKKSERIKMAVVKDQGSKTKSYKGNEWGRKGDLTEEAVEKMIEMRKSGFTLRQIAAQTKRYDPNKQEEVCVTAKTVMMNLRRKNIF
jgi:DNA invertase Pin-like site-specific DNA recombinase